MMQFVQTYPLQILAGACVAVGLAIVPAAIVIGSPDVDAPRLSAIPELDRESLDWKPPSAQSVLEKHLFVPAREATGQNSYPDLVVKGIYLGRKSNALFSLKSKPQANLRIWEGSVTEALDQVVDPKDPRAPLVEFLREWNLDSIQRDGVTVKHFITGATETYLVDYTPTRKVKDDAVRGYGQGVMPQTGGSGGQRTSTAKKTSSAKGGSTARQAPPGGAAGMADRVSGMVDRMSDKDKQQFMQQLNKNSGNNKTTGANNKTSNAKKSKK